MTTTLINTLLLLAIILMLSINLSYFCGKEPSHYAAIDDERFSMENITNEAKNKDSRCYGCDRDLVCVLKEQYTRFQMIVDGSLRSYSYEDRHFAPMSWFCDFDPDTIKNYQFLYFGETEEQQSQTISDLMDVLDTHGVDNHTISHIFDELSANRTKHSTSGSQIRRKVGEELRKSREAMRYLYYIYENDYRVFNLKSPFIYHKV
ncbi:Protein CBG07751 [Caenorhabditis briggsae]|uniref:Protein CBG07751 n=1 Tax=Caenorhabditis briggsae TaxID=6238 RepID=A8X457_CAEBR|nr:Protein CBG07751 [Caenorhabditis briggsae]CAP27417.2 Protein CBG07751 [Caenorhabditis briggsae]